MAENGLRIILDRAGTGKSSAILNEIAQEGINGRQILIVPEHASHQAERDVCALCGDRASRHVSVASFRWLASDILSRTGGVDETVLDGGGKLLMMYRAIQKQRDLLNVYQRPSQRAAFLEQMVNLREELNSYCVECTTLEEQSEMMGEPLASKLKDIFMIFSTYDTMLQENGRDRRDLIDRLLDKLCEEEAKEYFQDAHVYVDGFLYFNRREEEILRHILKYAASLTVVLLGDLNTVQGIFGTLRKTGEQLLAIAKEEHIPACMVPSPYGGKRSGSKALIHLEQGFYGLPHPFTEETADIHLCRAQMSYDEVEQVAAEVRSLVASGKCRYRDILVAARNMPDYEATIENVFPRYEIPVFLNRSRDILEKPVISLVVAALDIVCGEWAYEDVFHYLKTGMAGISMEDCDLLENYVLKWDIRGKMWTRKEPWIAHPDGYGAEMTENAKMQLERLNCVRDGVRAPLLRLKEALSERKTAEGKISALYRFLIDIDLPEQLRAKTEAFDQMGEKKLAEEYAQIWKLLCDVMDQFVFILGDVEVDEKEFLRLLKLILTQYDIGTIPVALDQVSITEITRNDRSSYQYVFLLGANDHVIPATGSSGGILTDSDRTALEENQVHLAPNGVSQMNMELVYLYAVLAQPTKGLYISWPRTDISGTELRPAFLVGRIEKLFPLLRVTETSNERLFAAPIPALEEAGRQENSSLWSYFEADQEQQAFLAAMKRAKTLSRGRLSTDAVRTLYGSEIKMSASRMDQVNSCHFAFFMQYGLKVKERRKAGLDAPEIGTFLHFLLENITREAKLRGGFQNLEEKELQHLVETYINQFIAEDLGGLTDKSARFKYLFGRLKKTAYTIIDNVAAELAVSDFIPMAFELEFGEHGAVPSVKIESGETGLTVGGKVDRVDGWIKDKKLYIRVVDYKTGKKKFDLSEILHGVGVQMLLYLFTLEKYGEDVLGRAEEIDGVIPAGVEYLPARDVILSMDRSATQEEIANAMEKELKRSGMLLMNTDVLEAMEHGATTEPHFLPLTIKKDGTITDGVATAAQIGKLSEYVDHLLKEIAAELGKGNIDADPNYQNVNKNACIYCPFASACHFEEGRGNDRKEYIASVKEQEFWNTVERICHDEEV